MKLFTQFMLLQQQCRHYRHNHRKNQYLSAIFAIEGDKNKKIIDNKTNLANILFCHGYVAQLVRAQHS